MSLEPSSDFAQSPALAEAQNTRPMAEPSEPHEGQCIVDASGYFPVINRSLCEGKRECAEVCPYDVFEVRPMDNRDFSELSFVAKLKSRVHGRLTAYTPRAAACQACGLCVAACPEKAISLVSAKDWLGWDIV
jgi:NAD-dependent dihydropyrimidine dehydrogenase PreA subunit